MGENNDTSDETRLIQLEEIATSMTDKDDYRMSKNTLIWLLGFIRWSQ